MLFLQRLSQGFLKNNVPVILDCSGSVQSTGSVLSAQRPTAKTDSGLTQS